MLINIFLNIISLYFLIIKYFYINIYKKTNFQTFPGFLLAKFKLDFLRLYLLKYTVPIIFISGTNGKTSTTHLLTHILDNHGLKYVTNHTGSNLKRGVLSSLVLSRFKEADFLVFEIDEGSVFEIFKSIPSNLKERYLILLNLSRDQLDRYGEVDIIASAIDNAVRNFGVTLYTEISEFSHHFRKKILITKAKELQLVATALDINSNPHLVSNVNFLLFLLSQLNLKIDLSKLTKFSLVLGRGKKFKIGKCHYELHLSKNPVSFNNNLNLLLTRNTPSILIVMNDAIPDGRDVSWFYDIDFELLKKALKNRNVFVAGSRAYGLVNLLKIAEIKSFNVQNFFNYSQFASKLVIENTFILSNYSATVNITNIAKKYV